MSQQTIEYVDPNVLEPDTHQPRRIFNEEMIREMAESYKAHGVIEPLEVDENNVIILGERRWRAAKLAKVKVPIIRKKGLTLSQRLERQLVDDAHREDLSPQERVWAYATAIVNINTGKDYTVDDVKKMKKNLPNLIGFDSQGGRGLTSGQAELTRRIGVNQQTIGTYMNYFKVGEELQKAFDEGKVNISYLDRVQRIKDKSEQAKAERLILEDLSKPVQERTFAVIDDLHAYIAQVNGRYQKAVSELAIRAARETEPRAQLETAEDYERAAKALREEARKRRVTSPEDKARLERYREHRQKSAEQARKTLEERMRTKVEQEVRTERASELLKDLEVVRTVLRDPDVREAAKQVLMPTATPKTEEKEAPRHWAEELEDEPYPVQLANWMKWNIERIGHKIDFFTTHYSGKDIDTFVEELKASGVRSLIDIRDTPVSQFKPEFSKDNLATKLRSEGINYVYYPELGVPRERRDILAKTGDWKAFFDWYDKNVLPRLDGKLNGEKLTPLDKPYAFMCVEKDPTRCHRHRIALELERKGMKSFDI